MVLFTTTSTYIQLQRQYDSYSYFNSCKILKNFPNLLSFLEDGNFEDCYSKQYMRFEYGSSFFENFDTYKSNLFEKLDSFTMKKCGCDFCQHVTNSQQLQRQYDFYSYSYSYSNRILKNSPNLLSFLEVDNSFFP